MGEKQDHIDEYEEEEEEEPGRRKGIVMTKFSLGMQ